MILLVTASPVGAAFAEALSDSTGRKTSLVRNISSAIRKLHTEDVEVAVVDEGLPELDNPKRRLLLSEAGSILPVFINFSISRPERVAREVLYAVRRYSQERESAQKVAGQYLGAYVRSELATILLSAEALLKPQLPSRAQDQLKTIIAAALRIHSQLESSE